MLIKTTNYIKILIINFMAKDQKIQEGFFLKAAFETIVCSHFMSMTSVA